MARQGRGWHCLLCSRVAGLPEEGQLAAPVHPDVSCAHCHACLHFNFKKSIHTIAHSTRKQNLLPCPQVVDFKHGSVHRVVVVSYETLRKHAAELAGCMDLLVCDEGHRCGGAGAGRARAVCCIWVLHFVSHSLFHAFWPIHCFAMPLLLDWQMASVAAPRASIACCRLKSAQGNKTISALTSLNCQRRVILTGTPIQNGASGRGSLATEDCMW